MVNKKNQTELRTKSLSSSTRVLKRSLRLQKKRLNQIKTSIEDKNGKAKGKRFKRRLRIKPKERSKPKDVSNTSSESVSELAERENEEEDIEVSNTHCDKEIKGIESEITNVLNKIVKKKKETKTKDLLQKKRERDSTTFLSKKKDIIITKKTAKDFNFHLQKNTDADYEKVIDIITASNKATHILLTLFELALNPAYYQINFSNKSKGFWDQVILYKELQPIFGSITSITLLEYWKQLSCFDIKKVKDIINNKEEYLNQPKIKLKYIVTALSNYLQGTITDIESYIRNKQCDVIDILEHGNKKKKEIQEEDVKAVKTKDAAKTKQSKGVKTRAFSKKEVIKEVKQRRNRFKSLKKDEQIIVINDEESDIEKEVKANEFKTKTKETKEQGRREDTPAKDAEELREKSKDIKSACSNDQNDKERLLKMLEKDTFMIGVINNLAINLMKKFTKYSKEYITEIIIANSCNVAKSYLMLNEISQQQNIVISPIDKAFMKKFKEKSQ